MVRLACPSCGAELEFRSSFSVFATCSYCGSTVVRQDRNVEAIGKEADLPAEMTPLQIGTELDWQHVRYTLVGRARVAWADGAWNEWYMVAGDQTGWLAEAQGFLAVLFPVPFETVQFTTGELPHLGEGVRIDGKLFRVTDIKSAQVVGTEGELPFRAPRGRTATYLDMLDATGGSAGIEDSPEGRAAYVGMTVDFDALALRNLREVEGWKPPSAAADAMDPLAA